MSYYKIGLELINKITSLGYEAYLVGGFVRDMLLKHDGHDIDIATNMPLDLIKDHFEVLDNGSKYLSVTIIYKDYKFETTNFRSDLEYKDHRHPYIIPAESFKIDSNRRDFTINALAIDKDEKIIDYHNGLVDLDNKIIRAIGDPATRFEEDALRILRALYFASKLNFEIEQGTLDAIIAKKDLLVSLSNERMMEYFVRIVNQRYNNGIKLINKYDLFSSVPEYKELLKIVNKKYDPRDYGYYYFLKYNKYLSISTKAERRTASILKLLIDSDFDEYNLYLYKKEYLKHKNIFLNLGCDLERIDDNINNLVLTDNHKLAINGNDLKDIYNDNEIGDILDFITKNVLNGNIENTKEAIMKKIWELELRRETIKGYIDSFETLTILVDKEIDNEHKKFYLYDGVNKIELEPIQYYKEQYSNKYVTKSIEGLSLNKDYYIIDENKNKGLLRSGSIVRDKKFDELFYYDGPLGIEYSKEKTTFRIWSPVAKEIIVELINGIEKEKHALSLNGKVWEYTHKGDIEGYGYIYHVRVFEKFETVVDTYAISSTGNALYNYVVDPNKFYKMKYKKPEFSGNYVDSIIYEVNIKDFTQDLNSKRKGCFLGLLENNPTKGGPTGIEYIKSLGVTHVQLLPTFDFEGVDDLDKTALYNWGYNPVQYFVPSGWYSENPNDPYSRINELLELIDEFHHAGIRVNMDVVFNHVYETKYLAINKLVPGYDFRVDMGGNVSNASGCGNVFATERKQVSRLVGDVLSYYMKVYNVSGFRFDLMGLLDIDTLNRVEKEMREIDPTVMLYGEGWNMFNPLPEELRPTIFNNRKIPGYAFFNDRFRDVVRGNQWNKSPGYAFNIESENFEIVNLVRGSCVLFYRFGNPNQSINYVECHDNYTFFDYGITDLRLDEYQVLDAARVALEVILVSEGIPFIHAGQEFFRTKQGVENSYKNRGLVNKFNYGRRDKYANNVQTIRDLIQIRKQYDVLRLKTSKDISERVHQLDDLSSFHKTGFVFIADDYKLFVIVKNDYKAERIDLGPSQLIFDGFRKCNFSSNYFTLKNPGVYIFRKDK